MTRRGARGGSSARMITGVAAAAVAVFFGNPSRSDTDGPARPDDILPPWHRGRPPRRRPTHVSPQAPLAQLDRASGYEPGGRRFESCRAHQFCSNLQGVVEVGASTLGQPVRRAGGVPLLTRPANIYASLDRERAGPRTCSRQAGPEAVESPAQWHCLAAPASAPTRSPPRSAWVREAEVLAALNHPHRQGVGLRAREGDGADGCDVARHEPDAHHHDAQAGLILGTTGCY